MNSNEERLGKEFHRTRQDDHEATLARLSSSVTEGLSVGSREGRVDTADRAYTLLYQAGKIEGPFEYPSVRAARLQREAVAENKPPEMRCFHWAADDYATSQEQIRIAGDPTEILGDEPDGTVAIMESVSDNDVLQGSSTVTWLRCRDLEDARRYVQQVGPEFSQPGPGEDDGVYTYRTIYLKAMPDQIQEVSAYNT